MLTAVPAPLVLLASSAPRNELPFMLLKYAEGATLIILCVQTGVRSGFGIPLDVLSATGSA